jgi:hypothetical protein
MSQSQIVIRLNRFLELAREYPEVVDDAIQAAAREGERYVKESIAQSPATGRQYGDHVSSEPGNPPRIDSGNLVNNINVRPVRDKVWAIRSAAEYAMLLEYGTSKLEARPHMTPMALWLEGEVEGIVTRYIRAVT